MGGLIHAAAPKVDSPVMPSVRRRLRLPRFGGIGAEKAAEFGCLHSTFKDRPHRHPLKNMIPTCPVLNAPAHRALWYLRRMIFLRLPCLLSVAALVSCSAVVQKIGRDPSELIGRHRSDIVAEFGTPTKYKSGGEVTDRFPVKGAWEEWQAGENYLFASAGTAGLLEPVLVPISFIEKSVHSKIQRYLFVFYNDNDRVRTALVSGLELR